MDHQPAWLLGGVVVVVEEVVEVVEVHGGGRDQLTVQSLGSRNGIYIEQDMNYLCYLSPEAAILQWATISNFI